jgi:hypothetical protein
MGVFESSVAVAAAALPPLGAGMAHADGPAGEREFIATVRGKLPGSAIPNGLTALDPEVIQYGYEACRAMDNHQDDPLAATRQFYGHYGFPSHDDFNHNMFMIYSAEFLCSRNFHLWGDGE